MRLIELIQEIPEVIIENITNFTGRTWLLSPLSNWYHQSTERIFLLTGEPGSGKSTFIAWLAGAGPLPIDHSKRLQLEQIRKLVGAVHFCRFASVDSTSPTGFAETVAKQLARNIRGFGKALLTTHPEELKIDIDINQHIEKVETGSNVTGIRIEKFSFDASISPEDRFKSLLADPFKNLYQEGYHEPIILLVDALDEAATYSGRVGIIQLLTQLENLPKQIRILATSRQDATILKNFRQVMHLDLKEDAPADADDVAIYISNQLAFLSKDYQTQLARKITDNAKGNFLFAHLVLNDLSPRLATNTLIKISTLPTKLGELYYQFLNRKWGQDEESWFKTFKTLIGVIAVSQGEGLSREQIDSITGQDSEKALRDISQYLNGKLPNGPFRLFHQSFEDFLLEDEENIDYHIDAASMHYLIVKYYHKQYRGRWEQLDNYGTAHLLEHLMHIDRQQRLSSLTDYEVRYLISHLRKADRYDQISHLVDLLMSNNI